MASRQCKIAADRDPALNARTGGLRSWNALERIGDTPTYKEAVVAIAALFDFGTPPDQHDPRGSCGQVNRELGNGKEPTTAAEMGDGVLAHFVGSTEDGRWMIVNVFESQAAMDRLMERVAPLMQRSVEEAGAPPPRVEVLSLHNVLT